jgi:hypothetical protein
MTAVKMVAPLGSLRQVIAKNLSILGRSINKEHRLLICNSPY